MWSVNHLDSDMLQRMADNAWMQLDEFIKATESEDDDSRAKSSQDAMDAIKMQIEQTINYNSSQDTVWEKFEFKQGSFQSYKLDITPDNQIWYIKFYYGQNKTSFRVAVKDYTYSVTWYKNYQEKNGSNAMVPSISGLRLWFVQKKVSSWYSGKKRSEKFWIPFNFLRSFTNNVIKRYHRENEEGEKLA